MIAQILAETNRDPKKRGESYRVDEFMPRFAGEPEPEPTDEEQEEHHNVLVRKVFAMHARLGGTFGNNQQPPPKANG